MTFYMLTEIGSNPNPKLVFYGRRKREALPAAVKDQFRVSVTDTSKSKYFQG